MNFIWRMFLRFISKIFRYFNSTELYFITSNEFLPEPLDKERESFLLEQLEISNDEKAKQELIEHNLRLVVYISKKFENTGIGLEDLISIGTIGLIKAISTFKKDKSIKLATYASKCIENEILMYIRKNSKYKNDLSLDVSINTDSDGNELILADTLGTSEEDVFRDIDRETEKGILDKILSRLSEREREIIKLRFGLDDIDEELTQKEVADYLGISQSYISRIEKKVMKKLRKDIIKLY